MPEIASLLEKLREVDPETWDAIDLEMPDGYDIRHIQNHTVDGQALMGWVIQGCLQRAIADRKWTAEIGIYGWPNTAGVNIRDTSIERNQIGNAYLGSPAAALLAAYLAAVQKSATKDRM